MECFVVGVGAWVAGLCYLPFFCCRLILTRMSIFFQTKNVALLLWTAMSILGISAALGAALIEIAANGHSYRSSSFDEAHFAIALLLMWGIIGAFLLFISLVTAKLSPTKAQRENVLKQMGLTRFQFWIQDIVISVLSSGTMMSAVIALSRSDARTFVAVILLVNAIFTFFISLDILRVQPFTMQPRQRTAMVLAMMFFAAVPGFWLLEALAWVATIDALALAESKKSR